MTSETAKPVFGDLNHLHEISRNLDERGLVLSFTAFADESFAELLKAFMQPSPAALSLMQGFNAPLGSFSARIKSLFALGLITHRQQEIVHRLMRIRNVFDYYWEPISFDDQSLSSHIAALHFSPLTTEFPSIAVEKVRAVVGALLAEIRSTTHQIGLRNLTVKSIQSELIPGLASDVKGKMSECQNRAPEINSSSGERRNFLNAQLERFTALIRMI